MSKIAREPDEYERKREQNHWRDWVSCSCSLSRAYAGQLQGEGVCRRRKTNHGSVARQRGLAAKTVSPRRAAALLLTHTHMGTYSSAPMHYFDNCHDRAISRNMQQLANVTVEVV
jgi:hypothetical protein